MRKKKFEGEVLSGHKDHAVEVPFDPAVEWSTPAIPLFGADGEVMQLPQA